jgi:hypothetical protein
MKRKKEKKELPQSDSPDKRIRIYNFGGLIKYPNKERIML